MSMAGANLVARVLTPLHQDGYAKLGMVLATEMGYSQLSLSSQLVEDCDYCWSVVRVSACVRIRVRVSVRIRVR